MSEEESTAVQPMEGLGGTAHQSACLIIISATSPARLGQMFKLDGGELVLGRSMEARLQIEDEGVSRRHAKVVAGPDGRYQLVDLGSTNGTFLNGTRVHQAPLFDGDKIQVGPGTVVKFSLQDQLDEQYQRSLYDSATRDALTRLYNKKYLLDALTKEFAFCLRHGVPLSLVLFDVDHFKRVNDTYGHPAGDAVLARIAQRVSYVVRTEDVLARYGGEEFALLLRQTDEPQALACAERCRQAVDRTDFELPGGAFPVTISLGVATLGQGDYQQPEELIAAADRYLYRAKCSGRNRVDARPVSGP